MKPIKTTKKVLRRFLLEHQQLLHPSVDNAGAPLLERVYGMLEQLECVQLDPVAAVSANQHLVLSSRISDFEPEMLNELLKANLVFEYFANAACVIPMKDFPIFQPKREAIEKRLEPELKALGAVGEEVLQRLHAEGPLPAKAFTSSELVHGYWDNQKASTKATSHALNLLMDMAKIRVVQREGKQRLYDLTQRTVPIDLLQEAEQLTAKEANDALLLKYMRAYRVFEPSDQRFGWQKLSAKERRDTVQELVSSGAILPVEIEGVAREYYILASDHEKLLKHIELTAQLDGAEEDMVHFLPPLDNLLWSRQRLEDLFDFTYRWEIYTPASKRKYGYYAMPILAGDRLVGRMDPRLDRENQHLHVQLLQFEPELEDKRTLKKSVHDAIKRFAKTHGAESYSIESGTKHSVH